MRRKELEEQMKKEGVYPSIYYASKFKKVNEIVVRRNDGNYICVDREEYYKAYGRMIDSLPTQHRN